jgi:DNA-binding transcriptional LysR family regulator
MKRVDSSDLAVFLAIAGQLNFRRAAAELGVSPSALSHALRGIEDKLGLRLVNRTTRSVSLTEAGERLHARIRPAFRDLDDALEDLNSFRGKPAGSLRINSSRAAARLVLVPAALRFMQAYPDVNVEVVVDDALVDIVAGGFDAGVRLGETLAGDMIALPFGPRQRMQVVGAPAFFERHAVPRAPQDLTRLPCARYRFRKGDIYRWEFEKGGVELDIEVGGALTLSDFDLTLEAALAGTALALAFENLVREHLAAGRLRAVLEDWCPYFPGFFLYYPNRRQHAAAFRAFLDFVRDGR